MYFSTREKDPANGKFISHVAFADFTKDLGTVLGISKQVVLPKGELGCFDEHGIFPFSPLQHDGQIFAYTTGWSRRISVSVETGIGLAMSGDGGTTFGRIGNGPILTSSLREPCLVGDGFVRVYDGMFHMWYIFGTGWKAVNEHAIPERVYKIGHAISHDGVSWQRRDGVQIIKDVLGEDECQALPTVVKLKNRYHMYFCYRGAEDFRSNPMNSYRLGYAYSDDLLHWIRDDDNGGIDRSIFGWDSGMMCYPNLFQSNDKTYLLYNGNNFGREGFGVAVLDEE